MASHWHCQKILPELVCKWLDWLTDQVLFLLGELLKLPLNGLSTQSFYNQWHLEKFLVTFDRILYLEKLGGDISSSSCGKLPELSRQSRLLGQYWKIYS